MVQRAPVKVQTGHVCIRWKSEGQGGAYGATTYRHAQMRVTYVEPARSLAEYISIRQEGDIGTRQAPLHQDLLPAPCPLSAPPPSPQPAVRNRCLQPGHAPPHNDLSHVRPAPLTAASGQEPEPAARPQDRREPHSERSTCSDRGRGLSKPEEGPSSTPSPPHTNTYQPTLEAQLTWSFWMDDHV